MTDLNTTNGLATHGDPKLVRVSTYRILPEGGLGVRVKNPGSVNVDELSYVDRVELARFLLKGLAFGPKYTMDRFTAGVGGPNSAEDRRQYVDSFGPLLGRSEVSARDLQTWINHQDSSDLDGVWHDRIEAYYADRGY